MKPRKFIEPLGGQPASGPIQFGSGRPGLYIAAAELEDWRVRLEACVEDQQALPGVFEKLLQLFAKP